jgi:hypothetical protein
MKQRSLPRRPARARLRCESLEDRTQPSVLSFRGGLDTQILAGAPNQTAGAALAVGADTGASGPQRQALLRFDNLFGTGPGQIPPGSTINRASLALWVGPPAGTAAPIELHRLNVAWDPATATWNTFGGNGIQADGGEAAAAPDGTVPTPTAGGFQMVGGLGAAVQAWANGTPDNGWVLLAAGPSQGWSFDSSESAAADRRPLLTVDYAAPNAPPNPSYQQLAGTPPPLSDAAWFTWESNLQAQRLARVPAGRTATYYFAQTGDDATGTGTIDQPWKTLAKAQAVLSASAGDVRLRFRGGGVWREPISLVVDRNAVTVDSYGTGAALFNRFTTPYTGGWAHVGGDLWKRVEPNPVGWLREGADLAYPFNHIYARANSSAAVAATAYAFYQDATGQDPNSGGAATLYLNAGPGVDPNALPGGFEMAPANPGWQAFGDNVRLENVRLHGYGLNPPGGALNYGVYVGGPAAAEVVLQDVDVFYTGYHAIGNAGQRANALTAVGCRAGLCTTDRYGNLTVFVSYSDNGGQELILADSEVGYGALPDAVWSVAPGGRNGLGVYDHTGLSGAAALVVALRTRYPDHPWQVASGTNVAAARAGRAADVRAFVVGEQPEAPGVIPHLGWGDYTVALANGRYDAGTVRSAPGQTVAVWFGRSNVWAYNCTFRVDASSTSNYGTGYAWFFGNGSAVGPVCVNCRFDMVVSAYEFGTVV